MCVGIKLTVCIFCVCSAFASATLVSITISRVYCMRSVWLPVFIRPTDVRCTQFPQDIPYNMSWLNTYMSDKENTHWKLAQHATAISVFIGLLCPDLIQNGWCFCVIFLWPAVGECHSVYMLVGHANRFVTLCHFTVSWWAMYDVCNMCVCRVVSCVCVCFVRLMRSKGGRGFDKWLLAGPHRTIQHNKQQQQHYYMLVRWHRCRLSLYAFHASFHQYCPAIFHNL